MGGGSALAVDLSARRAERSTPATESVLERVALALNSTLELREVLRLLAEITLEEAGAGRCSVFLLDGKVLRPAVAIGDRHDGALWSAFHQMEPVELGSVPLGWERLLEGRAVSVPEASECPLVPEAWVERFSLESMVLVPLLAAGEPCGLMVVDYPRRQRFAGGELNLLEAIGSYAGVAVRNARLFDTTRRRAELQEALARSAAALSSPLTTREIAGRLARAYADLLGARLCAIGLFDPERCTITTVASRGTRRIRGPIPLSTVPERILDRVSGAWAHGRRPVVLEDDPWLADYVGGAAAGASRYLVLPLVVEDRTMGAVLLGFDARSLPSAEERSAAQALAAMAASALERRALLDRLEGQVWQLEALHRVGVRLAEETTAEGLVDGVNELLAGRDARVAGVAFSDRALRRRLGAEEPAPEERRAWRDGRSWTLPDGTRSVPMRLGRQCVGALRVRPAMLSPQEVSFLEVLAREVAEGTIRRSLRASVEEAARERAVVADRERMASDLHDTVGQLVVSIGLLARGQVEDMPPGPMTVRTARLAELADEAKWEIDQALRALAFVPKSRRGLVPSLRALARSFERDTGIPVILEVAGRPTRLQPRIERALYRVVHQALANAWRHARCASTRVELAFRPDGVGVQVLDDGVGLGGRWPESRVGTGIHSMRRAIDEVGGTFRLRNARPRGVRVEAWVGREGG
ncbi:MAG: GAF domain-containing protein [Actinomycetota bacterium]